MGVVLAAEALSDEWVEELVAATADLPETGQKPVTVTLTIGKTRSATVTVANGRLVGSGDPADSGVTIPVTNDQLASFVVGSVSMAEAYMRGDCKPVGATGPLLVLVEVFENLARAGEPV